VRHQPTTTAKKQKKLPPSPNGSFFCFLNLQTQEIEEGGLKGFQVQD